MKNDTHSNTTNESIAYALGVIETRLAEIARDFNQSEQEFREWVGILLLSERKGTFNSLSSLRGKTSKMDKNLGKMAMDEQSHRKTRGADTSRKVKAPFRKGYKYNGTHWTQQPRNMKRVKELAKARQAKLMAKRVA